MMYQDYVPSVSLLDMKYNLRNLDEEVVDLCLEHFSKNLTEVKGLIFDKTTSPESFSYYIRKFTGDFCTLVGDCVVPTKDGRLDVDHINFDIEKVQIVRGKYKDSYGLSCWWVVHYTPKIKDLLECQEMYNKYLA